ncbi:hypothetical protein [Botrimarina sp.]|uniref:hypothetical protein n=1 Tax=Botrimarina sp. TaxID=2795802 RepID=UPI0032EB430D
MHARCLVEIAAVLGFTAGPPLRRGDPLASDALAEYWIASRCRFDTWGRGLRRLGHSHSAPPSEEPSDLLTRLVEEILLSEVLARVVTGVAVLSDRALGREDASIIAASTLDGCLEAKRRLRSLLSAWWPPDAPRTRHAETLRRLSSRWSDVLLARLGSGSEFARLATDRRRFTQSRRDTLEEDPAAARVAERLTLVAIREAMRGAGSPPVSAAQNERVGSAALGLLAAGSFDSFGLPRPAWMLRAERVVDETVGLIGLATEGPAEPNPRDLGPTVSRWWL